MVGVTIGNDGLVSASFSNGTQKSLAKILLTNFSSPSGLRQIGDSSFLASAASGKPILGNAGSAGFGTLRAGATDVAGARVAVRGHDEVADVLAQCIRELRDDSRLVLRLDGPTVTVSIEPTEG